MVEFGCRVYGQENVLAADFSVGSRRISDPKFRSLSQYSVRPGDVLVTMMGSSGAVGVVPVGAAPGIIDSHLLRLRTDPEILNGQFLRWFLGESTVARAEAELQSRGTIMAGLNSGVVRSLTVPVPPLQAQAAIADFLDRKTAAIDALIEKKERLLELLAEKRAALIHHAVTKGLDPDVPMKDSGVPWIGEIPAHWEVLPFRRLITSLEQGSSPVASDRSADPDEFAVLKLSCVSDGRFVPSEHKALPDTSVARRLLAAQAGDLLITRANTPLLVGDTCVVARNHPRRLLPDLIYRVRLRSDRADPEYVSSFLRSPSGRAQVEADARGSSASMVKISQSHIRDWCVPAPPTPEQESIRDAIRTLRGKVDEVRSRLGSQVRRLHEYRQALITAAVTGQVDVSGECPA